MSSETKAEIQKGQIRIPGDILFNYGPGTQYPRVSPVILGCSAFSLQIVQFLWIVFFLVLAGFRPATIFGLG